MLGYFQFGVLINMTPVNILTCFFWCSITPFNDIAGHRVDVNTVKVAVPICTSTWHQGTTMSLEVRAGSYLLLVCNEVSPEMESEHLEILIEMGHGSDIQICGQ